jgi:serine/threonine protein kinase
VASASPDAGSTGRVPARLLGDRYELGEVLGRGGMADVHRATDRLLHRDVAVKVLRDVAGDDGDRARFTGEARTLAGLSHPGLVMVLDAGLAGDSSEQPYLVMELVEGTTLGEVVRGGPVPLERLREIGARVAEALGYAHGQGVVHRDVKPSNVLVDAAGRVKLADFGIAKLLGDTASHTRTGMTIGSAAYLSPEQVRGEPITVAADVYSLGLVLLESITGERAYPGPAMEAAVARLHRAPEVPAHLPAPWRDLLPAMLAFEPAERPRAVEVAQRLQEVPDPGGTTLPLTGPAPTPSPLPTQARAAAPAPAAGPSWTDRAGDRMAAVVVRLRDRLRALEPHERGVAGAVGALVVFLVVAALAAGGGGSSSEVPADTPRRLEQPLQDLHDAVDGQSP